MDALRRHIHVHPVLRYPHGIWRGMYTRSTWYDVDLTIGELEKNVTGVFWLVVRSVNRRVGTNVFRVKGVCNRIDVFRVFSDRADIFKTFLESLEGLDEAIWGPFDVKCSFPAIVLDMGGLETGGKVFAQFLGVSGIQILGDGKYA
jgi:hypothetical protein